MNDRFGERLKYYIDSKGFTQKSFAMEIGISERSLGRYIANSSVPTLKIAIKMAKKLGITLDALLVDFF